jgi:hypothetical protein
MNDIKITKKKNEVKENIFFSENKIKESENSTEKQTDSESEEEEGNVNKLIIRKSGQIKTKKKRINQRGNHRKKKKRGS